MPTSIYLFAAAAVAAGVPGDLNFGDGTPIPPKITSAQVAFGDGTPIPPKIASSDLGITP